MKFGVYHSCLFTILFIIKCPGKGFTLQTRDINYLLLLWEANKE